MKKTFLTAITVFIFAGLVISCTSDSDNQNEEVQFNGLFKDSPEPIIKFKSLSSSFSVPKDAPNGLENAINDLVNNSREIMAEDPSIEEVQVNITDDKANYIFSPLSTMPIGSPLIGKCPKGMTLIHSCNGLSGDCQEAIDKALRSHFGNVGLGSNITVNIKVSLLGYVVVCGQGS